MTWATCQFDGSNTGIDTGQNRIRAASYGIGFPSRSKMLETDTRSPVTATFYKSIYHFRSIRILERTEDLLPRHQIQHCCL